MRQRARPGVRWVYHEHDARAARRQGVPLRRWLPWAMSCEAKSVVALDDPLPMVMGGVHAARRARSASGRAGGGGERTVRYGVIADVHANLPALEAVLAALRADRGRRVRRAPATSSATGRSRTSAWTPSAGLGAAVVAGNHDLIALGELSEDRCERLARESLRWTRAALDDATRDYLARLPRRLELPGGVVVAHGSLDDPQEYMLRVEQAAVQLDRLAEAASGGRILVLGHTHRAFASDGRRLTRRGRVALGAGRRWLLNPGAVGQSREALVRARFMVLDLERREATFHAVRYDVRRSPRAAAPARPPGPLGPPSAVAGEGGAAPGDPCRAASPGQDPPALSVERVEPAGGGASLGTRTLRGTAWAYGSYVGGQALVLVSTAILARVLTPSEFGVVALALVFITLLDTVSDLGLSPALVISTEDELRERAKTVFAITIGLGALLSALTAAVAPLAALFFDQPELFPLLAVLGLNFFVRSLGATHYALAQKRMDFRSRTAAELAGVVTRGATGIAPGARGLRRLEPRGRLPGRHGGADGDAVGAGSVAPVRSPEPGAAAADAAVRRHADRGRHPRRGDQPGGLHVRRARARHARAGPVHARLPGPADADHQPRGRGRARTVPRVCRRRSRGARPRVPRVGPVRHDRRAAAGGRRRRACRAVRPALFGEHWEAAVDSMRVLSLYAFGVALGIPAGIAYKATGQAGILLKLAIPRAALVVTSIACSWTRGSWRWRRARPP